MDSATAVAQPDLMSAVKYTDGQGRTKAALVIGTPESTGGRIPEGQVSLAVFNPMNGNRYFRRAVAGEDGTFLSADRAEMASYSDDDEDSDDDEG